MNILTTDWVELGRQSPAKVSGCYSSALLHRENKTWVEGKKKDSVKVPQHTHLGTAGAITCLYFHRTMLLKLVWATWWVTAGLFWLQGIQMHVSHFSRGLITSFPLKTASNLTVSYCHIDIIFIILHRVKFCFLPFTFWKYVFFTFTRR